MGQKGITITITTAAGGRLVWVLACDVRLRKDMGVAVVIGGISRCASGMRNLVV